MKRLQRDMEDLERKYGSYATDVEKRIAKVKAEIDLTPIVKQLRDKVDVETLRKEVSIIEGKFKSISETLQALRRDAAIYSH